MNVWIALAGSLTLSLVLARPAAADPADSPGFAACMDASSDTMSMIACVNTELAVWDERLNQAYGGLMKRIATPRKEQLKAAQRAWLKFRDANCAFHDDPDGGSMARLSANQCMLTMTAQRAEELGTFLSMAE